MSAASSPALQPYPGGSLDAPKPVRSGRTTLYLPARWGTHWVQAREDSELPWIITTVSGVVQGGPNQWSSYAIHTPGLISAFCIDRLHAVSPRDSLPKDERSGPVLL
jgi:hypothetical protein